MKKLLLSFLAVMSSFLLIAQNNAIDIKTTDVYSALSSQANVYYYLVSAITGKTLGYNYANNTDFSLTTGATNLGWTYSKSSSNGFEITLANTDRSSQTTQVGAKFANTLSACPLGKTNSLLAMRVEYVCLDSTTWDFNFNLKLNTAATATNGTLASLGFPATLASGGVAIFNISSIFTDNTDVQSNAIQYFTMDFKHDISNAPLPNGLVFSIKRITFGLNANTASDGPQYNFEGASDPTGTTDKITFSGITMDVERTATSNLRASVENNNLHLTATSAYDPASATNNDNILIKGINTNLREKEGYFSVKYKSDMDIDWENQIYQTSNYYPILGYIHFPQSADFKTMVIDMNTYFPLPRTSIQYLNFRKPSVTNYNFYLDDLCVGKQTTDTKSLMDPDVPSVIVDYEGLSLGYADGNDASYVTKAVILPTTGSELSNIQWQSSNLNILNNTGDIVSLPETPTSVTLTATITKNNVIMSKSYVVVVSKDTTTEIKNVQNTLNDLISINKNSDGLIIKSKNDHSVDLRIVDLTGRLMQHVQVNNSYFVPVSLYPNKILIFVAQSSDNKIQILKYLNK